MVWALLDSGSTHNFVREEVASRLSLPVLTRRRACVALPDGGTMASSGVCKDLHLKVQGTEFQADMYVIPLTGYDVVLGIWWLNRLGRIMWDFTAGEMEFKLNGTPVIWYAESPSEPAHLNAIGANRSPETDLARLLEEFEDVFATPTGLPPPRSCDHRIRLLTGTDPVAVRPYRYPHLQKDEIERQCTDMLANGIIRESRSPFSSPVLLVKKADNSWRFCVDYRELNSKTVKDKFPIPVVDELLDELHGATYFTKLDLTSGYHQIRMAPSDIDKTAFRTHHGHYEFLVMPFGLSNAPSTFQSLMNTVFKEHLRRFVLVFFDDILIYSQSWAIHVQHIRTVLSLLRMHRLYLKRSKCSFGQLQVAYLGHVIQHSGVAVDQSKISAIKEWPQPRTMRALRGFLGLSGYYRKFIKNYGIISTPLTSLLRRNSFVWDDKATEAFEALKKALSESPVLALPDFDSEFVIECDASGSGIGAVLQQQGHPIALFSRKLADRHHKLAAYERELIGLAKAVSHWRPYL